MKPKRINKSKEDIAKHMAAVADAKEKRIFVKNKFFPALCKATESIGDADTFLQSFSSMVMESFLALMKEKKFKEFNFQGKLDQKSTKYESMKALMDLFGDMNMKEAQDLIEGMKNELRMFYRDDMNERKLESLKTRWLAEE